MPEESVQVEMGAAGKKPASLRERAIAWAQRLGNLLDLVGTEDKTGELADYIARKKPAPTPLVPSQPFAGIRQLQRWRLLVNDTVESDD